MPKVTLRKENEIIRAVREEIVVNPMISLRRLQANLKQRGFETYAGNPLEDQYLKKLVEKLQRRAYKDADNQKIEDRLAKTGERFRVMIDRLMKIAFWKPEFIREGIWPPETKDIVKALDTVQKMDLALLQAEMDAGIFERHLGTMDIELARKRPIPEDKREAIWATFKNWGMIPEDDKPEIENGNSKRNATTEQPCRALMVIEQPAQ